MAATSSIAYKQWTRILSRWPVDKVRPENVSFQKVMRQRLDKHAVGTSANAAATSVKSNEAMVSAVKPRAWEEGQELRQANALHTLLEDRYAQEYRMPEALRRPASNPVYYDNLIAELEEAPTRTWFGRLIKRWKGALRWS